MTHDSLPVSNSSSLDLDALCPESYRVNTPDEERLLVFAKDLQRQYSHLYPERRPLLLCPTNEYGVKVMTPDTLSPKCCVCVCLVLCVCVTLVCFCNQHLCVCLC